MTWLRICAALAACLLALPSASRAGAPTPAAMEPPGMVDVALMLAVDVSSSVDADERRFQRMAYARALADPLVMRAALGGRSGRIALGYMEWSGPGYQNLALPVRAIGSPDEMQAFAAQIGAMADAPVAAHVMDYGIYDGTTAMGNALARAAEALRASGFAARSTVIDISADGVSNDGLHVDTMRDGLLAQGIIINGLPIAVGPPATDGYAIGLDNQEQRLEIFFADCVIGGPGAFHILARGWKDVEQALRAKLILELAGLPPSDRQRVAQALGGDPSPVERVRPAQFRIDLGADPVVDAPRIDCASGMVNPLLAAR
ncbi:DUF1194 domain-containing protein [Thetidibacter halocola]|uniref:DUF1194 domain-containing protein n=1 Tax=Thetidibacter halocola TaxID=2827239 RepID=A0A8J7WDP5_9RHOB|nr:DUF1194 domain-containing protein [Thetidibacter halocola]MBS0125707.1 DUF1194 domain-containing protein [Thetidibacter halocola]